MNPFERAYVWHVQEPVDVKQMESAAATLLGTHDFSAFQSAGADRSSTIRTLTRFRCRQLPPVAAPRFEGERRDTARV